MKLLKSVDEPESPEVPRGSEVGPSTNPHDFESSSLRPLRYRPGSDIPIFALAAYPQGGPVMTAFFGAEPALRLLLCHTFSKVASPVRKEFSAARRAAER